MSDMLSIIIDISDIVRRMEHADSVLANPADMYRAIAQDLESATETNFAAQGRPDWAPLSKSTLRNRLKRNNGKSAMMILQDSGMLAGSVTSGYGNDYAIIGTNVPYARIHQYGGEIKREGGEVKVRLRTDKKGNLLRQADHQNLAVFARGTHKLARESTHNVGPYTINIPARPYLPFRGAPGQEVLQPEVQASILQTLENMLSGAFD